jgi:transposase
MRPLLPTPRLHRYTTVENALANAVQALSTVLESLNEQIEDLTDQLTALSHTDQRCQLLTTIPGVGPVTAVAFLTAIDDPARFPKSRSVGAYLGLTPRRYQSGEIDVSGHISRCGDGLVRSYLYEAAGVLLTRVTGPRSKLGGTGLPGNPAPRRRRLPWPASWR